MARVITRPTGTNEFNNSFIGWLNNLYEYLREAIFPSLEVTGDLTVGGDTTTDTLSIAEGAIISGTYTPTLTNSTNVAASTAFKCQYLRVGNVVTVSGKVDIDPTAAAPTATALKISLPISSNLVNTEDCSGVANCLLINGQTGVIIYSSFGAGVFLQFDATDAANRSWVFSFTYEII